MSTSARRTTATSPTVSDRGTPPTPSGKSMESGIPAAETVGDVAVVLRALVDILDQQLDRRTGRLPLEDAGQDLDLVGLAPLRRVARLSGPAPVKPVLDVGLGERDPRRHAIDDDADRRS